MLNKIKRKRRNKRDKIKDNKNSEQNKDNENNEQNKIKIKNYLNEQINKKEDDNLCDNSFIA